jgi:L-threonylcarbamoyladenylate synthase
MFEKTIITAFPTDTSWGLGVRADDAPGLKNIARLKKRKPEQMFSLMVRDMKMLQQYAEVPADFPANFFFEKPRTAILKPKETLPQSDYWPENSVAFRVATIPEVAAEIEYPITATSANITGQSSIFSAEEIRKTFGKSVLIFPGFSDLPEREASEIWDFTENSPKQLR